MKECIKRQNLNEEFYTAENCFITELSNSQHDPDVSIARARVKVGETTRWHRLNGIVERYYIISGLGRVEIGAQLSEEIKAGDIVLIPAMCRQRITNIGAEDLIFLAICSPRFSNDAYQDIENE